MTQNGRAGEKQTLRGAPVWWTLQGWLGVWLFSHLTEGGRSAHLCRASESDPDPEPLLSSREAGDLRVYVRNVMGSLGVFLAIPLSCPCCFGASLGSLTFNPQLPEREKESVRDI